MRLMRPSGLGPAGFFMRDVSHRGKTACSHRHRPRCAPAMWWSCAGAFAIVVAGRQRGDLGTVLVRHGPLERLRSHVLPEPEDLQAAGLPLADYVVCCDRMRPAPPAGTMRVGAASPVLLARIALTMQRVAETDALERTPPIRSTIWRCPGGDRGRQVGAKSIS